MYNIPNVFFIDNDLYVCVLLWKSENVMQPLFLLL